MEVSDGLLNVMLGSINNTLASTIDGHDKLYLGITVGNDIELSPRVLAVISIAGHPLKAGQSGRSFLVIPRKLRISGLQTADSQFPRNDKKRVSRLK